MRYLKNKELLIILIIYIILTIKLIITDVTLYTNIINPIFWGCILAYFLWYRKKLI